MFTDLLCEPRIVNKLLMLWFGPDPVKIYNSCPDPPVRFSAGLQALIDGYGIGENGQIDATVNSKY